MPNCLGLYIEDNIIKYAKVSKDRDNFKVESFGMKFYDNIDDAVKQIVSETYSYKTPISTNLSHEKYTYSQLFNLLSQKDLDKAAKTEFEYFCSENHKNSNALDFRNLLLPSLEDKDKFASVYAYTEKSDIEEKLKILSGYKVNSISPLPVSIFNLIRNAGKDNKIIVNIEENTSVTFIINGQVYKIELIDIGMKEIFDNIIKKENSYAKAYEICKNTTIYTTQGKNLQIEENEYMEDIMPTLYKVVKEIKKIIKNSKVDVKDIYITGLAATINNIDLYFQENFTDMKCEILAPFFIQKSNIKLNIMDYIEVNSAIALALQGLGIGYKEINFKNKGTLDELNQLLKTEISGSNSNSVIAKVKNRIKTEFSKKLDNTERNMLRCVAGILIVIVLYVTFSTIVINQINQEETKVEAFISDSTHQLVDISNNIRLLNARKQQYQSMIDKINEANDKVTEGYEKKNVLPNFLTEVMFNIPKEVQLLSIENPSGKAIKIQAQSRQYEQLGYFIAKIKNEAILTDVTTTSGERQGEFILTTIEGNLPY